MTACTRYEQWRDYIQLKIVADQILAHTLSEPKNLDLVGKLCQQLDVIVDHPIHGTPMSYLCIATIDGQVQVEYMNYV